MITRTTCRICGGPFDPVLSLGQQYVSDFLEPSQPDGIKAPLELVLCPKCTLLQLRHTVPCNAMYSNYWYRSGTNQTMRDALADIARGAEQLMGLRAGDAVLDIGCNDGTLLASYETPNIVRIGFDPAENLAALSRKKADWVVSDFFTAEAFMRTSRPFKPRIVTSIAMFYDLEDPNKFVEDVKSIMHPEGVWIVQMSYLPLMLKQHDLGNICHEHLEYYSLKSLEYLLGLHDMEVTDVQFNDVNGGSIRVFIQNCGRGAYSGPAQGRVREARAQESRLNLGRVSAYKEFISRIERIKKDVREFIVAQTFRGYTVAVLGASTKGNVMLQYFELNHNLISFASERNPDKWGKETVGTRIPIISEEDARKAHPDFFLVLPWHFLEEFRIREKKYLKEGGRFVVPFPHFTLI